MKSALTYERLSQGELSAELSADEQAHLSTLKADDQAYLERFPAAALRVAKRHQPMPWMMLSAAAALVVILGGLGTLIPRNSDTRIKSAATSLFVYHKTATGTELLSSQATLQQKDEIQMAYFSAKKQYATILSVDGRGTVTTHLPLNANQAVEVETPKQPFLLPYSYTLDDAPNFETIYLITSDQPFAIDKIRPFVKAVALQKGARLELPSEFTATSFRITKKETSQ